MHIVPFRLLAAMALIYVFAIVLAACSRPPERNLWREMIENGEL